MRGNLAGNRQALLLRGTNHIKTYGGGDVLNMQRASRQLAHHDVARDLKLFALRRPAEQTKTRGDDAFVDLASTDQAFVLAVAHEHLAEHLAVIHDAAHHAGFLDTAAVISEGDSAASHHVPHLGDDFALEALAHGSGGIDAALAHLGGAGDHVADHDAVVGNGVGVRHGAYAGEAALDSSARAACDIFLVLETGLAQMHVHVHQAGNKVFAGQVANLGALDLDVLGDASNLIAFDQDVDDSVELDGRIDDVSVLKNQGHCRHLPKADTLQPYARRCRRRPVPE